MAQKILLFKSEWTNAVYCWNGKEVIVVIGDKFKNPGAIWEFHFGIIQIEKAYINNSASFGIGDILYTVLAKI